MKAIILTLSLVGLCTTAQAGTNDLKPTTAPVELSDQTMGEVNAGGFGFLSASHLVNVGNVNVNPYVDVHPSTNVNVTPMHTNVLSGKILNRNRILTFH